MKRWIGIASFVTLFSGCGGSKPVTTPVPPAPNKDWAITLGFSYDFTNYVPCSASVTKGCISGFTWGYLQSGVAVPLKTPAPSVCSGTTQPESCTDTANSTLGVGPVTYFAVANAIDNNGNAVSSTQGNSAVSNVTLIAPTNVSATLK